MNTWKHFSEAIINAVLLFLLIGTFAVMSLVAGELVK